MICAAAALLFPPLTPLMDHRRNDRLIGLWRGLSKREGREREGLGETPPLALTLPSRVLPLSPSLATAPLGVNVGGLLGTCDRARRLCACVC